MSIRSRQKQTDKSPNHKQQWESAKALGSRFTFVGTIHNKFGFPKHKYDDQGCRT